MVLGWWKLYRSPCWLISWYRIVRGVSWGTSSWEVGGGDDMVGGC